MSIRNEYLPMKYWIESDGTLKRAFYEYEENAWDSPREWGNLGVIVNASGYCITGENDVQTDDIEEWLISETGINREWYYNNTKRYGGIDGLLRKFIKEKCMAFEYLTVYEHSGVTIRCGYTTGWDYSNVGFIYVPKDNQEVKQYRKGHSKEQTEEWASGILHSEVAVLRDYLEGNVYCAVCESYDEESGQWNMEDSVGDIYLTSDTREEENNMAVSEIKDYFSAKTSFIDSKKVEDAIENNSLDLIRGQLELDFNSVA